MPTSWPHTDSIREFSGKELPSLVRGWRELLGKSSVPGWISYEEILSAYPESQPQPVVQAESTILANRGNRPHLESQQALLPGLCLVRCRRKPVSAQSLSAFLLRAQPHRTCPSNGSVRMAPIPHTSRRRNGSVPYRHW